MNDVPGMYTGAVEGQLAVISHKSTLTQRSYWVYGIVTAVFDDRYQLKTEDGYRILQRHSETEDKTMEGFLNPDVKVDLVVSKGDPVLVKKSIFGKYKFPKR